MRPPADANVSLDLKTSPLRRRFSSGSVACCNQISGISRVFGVPQRHAPLNPLCQHINLLTRSGGGGGGGKFFTDMRHEIFVVTVKFDDLEDVANSGHGNQQLLADK